MNAIRRLSIWQRIWLVAAICSLIYAIVYPFLDHLGSPREFNILEDIGVPFLSWLVFVVLLYTVGTVAVWFARGRAILLYGVGAVSAVWFAAFTIESATRLMVSMFRLIGADLPVPTLLTLGAVQNYVPWIMAVASALVIGFLWAKASPYFLHACAAVAALTAVSAAIATLSLVLPVSKCGVMWPEWPRSSIQSPKPLKGAPNLALKPDAPVGAPGSSCR